MVQVTRPSDSLLEQCEAPVLKPTTTVGDIQENRTRATVAYDRCSARFRCLVWWITSANHETPPAECRTTPTEP